jgi:hypothetical protein
MDLNRSGRCGEENILEPTGTRTVTHAAKHVASRYTDCAFYPYKLKKTKTKLHGLSPRANYTDRATAACRRSQCQLLLIEGATWSA